MAAASYVTDLTDIDDGSGTFTEPTNALLGALTNADTDNFIQGTTSVTKTTGASGAPALAGIGIQDGAAHTIASPNAYYCWYFVGGGGLIDTYANGGVRLLIGNSSANYRFWYVNGNDFFPYIGWECVAIETDNAVVAADGSVGSPTSTKQYFGAVFNCKINIGKGNPMGIDALRWGRTITVTNGDLANGYATFAGIAAQNDSNTNRWGQFQSIPGGYQLQGRLLLGTSGTAVDFRVSNVNIVSAISRKVAPSFNAIEIQNASSRVDWDSVAWSALGTTSRGTFTVTDNADVNITGCSFTGLSTFALLSNTDILDSIFRQCDAVTAPGSNLTGSQILTSRVAADASALIWNANVNTLAKLDNMTFSRGTNAHHAIELGPNTPSAITLSGWTVTGFNASNSQNDSVILNSSGKSITVNVTGNTGTISYKNTGVGSATTIVSDQRTLTVEVRDGSGTLITDATEITLVRTSDTVVLYEVESVTTGSTTYTYAYSSDTTCYLNVLSVQNYVPRTVEPVTLVNADQTVVVQLEAERGRYSNP